MVCAKYAFVAWLFFVYSLVYSHPSGLCSLFVSMEIIILPDDVWSLVVQRVPPATAAAFRLVCRRFAWGISVIGMEQTSSAATTKQLASSDVALLRTVLWRARLESCIHGSRQWQPYVSAAMTTDGLCFANDTYTRLSNCSSAETFLYGRGYCTDTQALKYYDRTGLMFSIVNDSVPMFVCCLRYISEVGRELDMANCWKLAVHCDAIRVMNYIFGIVPRSLLPVTLDMFCIHTSQFAENRVTVPAAALQCINYLYHDVPTSLCGNKPLKSMEDDVFDTNTNMYSARAVSFILDKFDPALILSIYRLWHETKQKSEVHLLALMKIMRRVHVRVVGWREFFRYLVCVDATEPGDYRERNVYCNVISQLLRVGLRDCAQHIVAEVPWLGMLLLCPAAYHFMSRDGGACAIFIWRHVLLHTYRMALEEQQKQRQYKIGYAPSSSLLLREFDGLIQKNVLDICDMQFIDKVLGIAYAGPDSEIPRRYMSDVVANRVLSIPNYLTYCLVFQAERILEDALGCVNVHVAQEIFRGLSSVGIGIRQVQWPLVDASLMTSDEDRVLSMMRLFAAQQPVCRVRMRSMRDTLHECTAAARWKTAAYLCAHYEPENEVALSFLRSTIRDADVASMIVELYNEALGALRGTRP